MAKNKNIFITSTGTNIGKTYCTVEILKEILNRKVFFNAYKPILSGFNIFNIKDSDSYKILKTNNKKPKIENIREISPWLFEKAIAPSIAAKEEYKSLKYNDVLEWCLKKSDNNIINIFEGEKLSHQNSNHMIKNLSKEEKALLIYTAIQNSRSNNVDMFPTRNHKNADHQFEKFLESHRPLIEKMMGVTKKGLKIVAGKEETNR